MSMQTHLTTVTVGAAAAAASSILLAADDVTETFWGGAERWGLWAALTLVLVLAVLWGLYRIVTFVLDTLVDLIRDNQRCLTKVADAIRNAPCGEEWDSDGEEQEHTPGGTTKAVERVRRRQRRADDRGENQ